MKIIIYQNREVYKENSKIGNDSENKVETLEFEFPEEYADFTKYIEFQIKGEKYVDLIEGNKYVITREVAKYGKIKTQVVLKKNTENDVMVFKSDIFTLNVSNSINATENLVHTVGIDLIEKIVTKNSEQDVRLDALEADNIINKSNISNIQTEQTNQNNRLDSLELDNTTNKTDILNIKQEQITQNTNIQELQTDNTSNKSKIADLETKNAEQDTNIQKNTDDIAEINAKNTAQDEEIAQLKEKDTTQDELIEQLQAENTKLKKEINSMQIPGEATGNPIHLTDSSDMECEIVPISGTEQETREGYNSLDLSGFTPIDKNEIVATRNEDGSIKLNGTSTAGFGIYIPINKTLSSGSYKHSIGTVIPEGVYISLDNTSNTVISNSTGNEKEFEITEETSYTNYLIWINADVTLSNLTIYPMLYQGTEDKPYEPYGASPSPEYPSPVKTVGQNGSVEIKVCNKNFIKMSDSQQIKNNGITATKIEKGWSIQGTSTAFVALNLGEVIAKAGTHTFSTNFSKSFLGIYVRLRDKTTNAIVAEIGNNQVTSRTYTINTDINANFVINIPSGTTVDIQITETQFEKSPTKTNYTEHESYTKVLPIQKEFVKIGDVEDTFIKRGDKWYEEHYMKKRVLNGSETITAPTSQNFDEYLTKFFQISVSDVKYESKAISDYFKYIYLWNNDTTGIWIGSSPHINIRILKEIASTKEDFKTWLSNNNVTVYYVLAEPELIKCTAEQEEILNSFYTYKNVTNISVDGIGTLKVNYKKDLETIINNLSATSVAE